VEVIRELNRAFIYPTVFVDEGTLDEVGKYKAIVFPIAREDPAGAFLKAWRLNSRLLRRPYDGWWRGFWRRTRRAEGSC